MQTAATRRSRERAALIAIVVVAFVVRVAYVRMAVVDDPLRGDAWQYFCYAWNLLKHGTFSLAGPSATIVPPDSFRDPGYPAFFALLMALRGTGREVYDALLLAQCVLGAATVGLCMALARRWMGFAAACAVGILMACWPHLVGFAGYVLSETLLGFLLALAIWLLDTAARHSSRPLGAAAGVAFAAAALTNAIILPIVPLLAIVAAWKCRSQRALWLVVLVAFALPCAAWIARNATLPPASSASGRAAINVVQGAWPEYHAAAFRAIQLGDPQAKETMIAIDAETRTMLADPAAGMKRIADRFALRPLHYAAWYARKPALLWAWDVGVGQGDIYVFPTFHSLFEDNAAFHAWAGVCFVLNPMLALLALAGCVAAICSSSPPAARWTAALLMMATLLFSLLQAEPRYAVPYRGPEVLMAVFGALSLHRWWVMRARPASV